MTFFRFGRWVRHDNSPIDISADPDALTAHGSRHARAGYQEGGSTVAPTEEVSEEQAASQNPPPKKTTRRTADPREVASKKTDPREGRRAQ